MNTPFEKRICFSICICQLTAVLSCVSIVYLTVAVYYPAYKTLTAGYSEDPVMCTTISNNTVNCEDDGVSAWYSCGEWCLSKSSGTCTQISVDVRTNGTNVRLEQCEREEVIWCDGIDPKKKQAKCIEGECGGLNGLFNCTLASSTAGSKDGDARCRDLTDVLSCNLTSLGPQVNCNNRATCKKLEGLYQCMEGHCAQVRPPFKCEKKCTGIKVGGKSVIIREGDVIFSASCKRAMDIETETEIWSSKLTDIENQGNPSVLFMFCTDILDKQQNKSNIRLSDCFNGSLIRWDHFGPTTDINSLISTHQKADRLVDPSGQFIPSEPLLLIYNNTRLYINTDFCVNSLILNECEKFHATYGGDGKDLRSQSRFQCFHRPNFTETTLEDPNIAVLRFSRMGTILELIIASTIPVTLAIVSCFILVLCTRMIHVGDDSHFYFQCCGSDPDITVEKAAVEAMAL